MCEGDSREGDVLHPLGTTNKMAGDSPPVYKAESHSPAISRQYRHISRSRRLEQYAMHYRHVLAVESCTRQSSPLLI